MDAPKYACSETSAGFGHTHTHSARANAAEASELSGWRPRMQWRLCAEALRRLKAGGLDKAACLGTKPPGQPPRLSGGWRQALDAAVDTALSSPTPKARLVHVEIVDERPFKGGRRQTLR